MRTTIPGAALAATLMLAAVGCSLPGVDARTTPATGANISAATAPGPDAATTADALAQLAELKVSPEDTGAHYKRTDWKHWIGQPTFGNGCDTRKIVLIQQGHHAGGGAVERNPSTCAPYAGHGNSWLSTYDDVTVTDPGQLDVDHLVSAPATLMDSISAVQAVNNIPATAVALDARARS